MAQGEVFDFIIIGSGGGSVPAAMAMVNAGKRPLIIEKQSLIGGSSARSGGMLWIPASDQLKAAGLEDSPEKALRYLDAVVGDAGPGSTPERRDAYVREAPEMLRFMERHGLKMRHAKFADYYDEKPGGIAQGRALVPQRFDLNRLGAWAHRLSLHPMTSDIPSDGSELRFVQSGGWRRYVTMARIGTRIFRNKYLGARIRGFGNALMGQLFNIALKADVPIWTETEASDFIVENGRVVGVVVEREGRKLELRADLGILINAGGFSRNLAMREAYQPKPASNQWTQANVGDTGEMINKAVELGAAVDLMDEAFWFPCSFFADGTTAGLHSAADLGKPHIMVVDKAGKRFANEAISHMEFGQKMYAADAVPAWAIFDSNHRDKYTFGMILPRLTPERLIVSGYLKRADTLEQLAGQCGIDPAGLAQATTQFNTFARGGVDEDFGRGETGYQRANGDRRVTPNPNLGPIERAPFYAVAIYPGDVGTCGGIVTDEYARALRPDGTVIPGLYATGISTATVMGRAYPGGGISIGPSMTFGYIAARHAARVNDTA